MTCGVCTQLCVHVQLKPCVEGGVCGVLGLGLGVDTNMKSDQRELLRREEM